eukprot:TRINITY_DN5255_c0_g1_i1.p1 TRINITY_DN5255_c0_g1~~TRINITY_DN5255_c0_g1_i1.p1  ORF type:complete len:376 (+),score=64.39 TRINITY_DN5255_c0_g1_i1:42-1130(+)
MSTAADRRKRMLEAEGAKLRGRASSLAGMVSPTVKRTSSIAVPATHADSTARTLFPAEAAPSVDEVIVLPTQPTNESQTARELRLKGINTEFDPTPRKQAPIAPSAAIVDDEARQSFVHQPAPKGMMVQMQIRRERSGLKKFYPEYRLFFKEQDKFCLAARKRKKNKTTNYLVSMSESELSKRATSFVGKLRSNFLGTAFTIYDDGLNPSEGLKPDKKIRQELGAVIYEANLLGTKGPRKMHCVIPAMTELGTPVQVQPRKEEETLVARHKQHDMVDLVQLHNKSPQWNDESQSYVLNFKGRVTIASVKNFQLIHPDNPDYVVLQFGKCGPDVFTMDYQYPLSAFQAFCICLSSFDNKLACE